MIKKIDSTEYPLTLTIADGTDGSGCHRIYNQMTPMQDTTTNFLLFGFRVISITNRENNSNTVDAGYKHIVGNCINVLITGMFLYRDMWQPFSNMVCLYPKSTVPPQILRNL